MTEPTADNNNQPSALATIRQADNVLRLLKYRELPGSISLLNGVILKLTPVAPFAIREAAILEAPPSVPMVMIESKGREEPNPNDPEYLKALEDYSDRQVARVADVLMVMGTSVETVPEHIQPPESDDWVERLQAAGLNVEVDSKYKRYLAWLRLYAIMSEEDLRHIIRSVTRLSGVTEEEVQRAAAAFRRPA